MTLLLDQNISYRLVEELGDKVPFNITHVKFEHLYNSTDFKIWQYAKRQDCTIVTFDADFYDLQVVKGFPPKIIWLKFGNRITNQLREYILQHKSVIAEFLSSPDYGCLEIR